MILKCIFSNEFNKPCVNFWRVWRKNTNCLEILRILEKSDKNSIEKLNFYRLLERLLLKIEPTEITPFFYNNFFQFRGAGTFPVFSLAAPMTSIDYILDYFF